MAKFTFFKIIMHYEYGLLTRTWQDDTVASQMGWRWASWTEKNYGQAIFAGGCRQGGEPAFWRSYAVHVVRRARERKDGYEEIEVVWCFALGAPDEVDDDFLRRLANEFKKSIDNELQVKGIWKHEIELPEIPEVIQFVPNDIERQDEENTVKQFLWWFSA